MYDLIIKDIINNKYNSLSWIMRKYPDFYSFINNRYTIDINWREKLYLYINDLLHPPLCYCGNKLKFIKGGYRTYCSVKCMANSPDIVNKRKKTCMVKYGVDSPMKNEDIKEKLNSTIYNRYGVYNISKLDSTKNKVKQTNNNKYGVDYVSKLDSVKVKLSKSMSNNLVKLIENKKLQIESSLVDKISDLDLSFIEIIETSTYKLCCNKGHNFVIHKTMLNDRIRNKNVICTICNKVNSASDSQNQIFDIIVKNYNGLVIKNNRTLIGQELDIYIPDLKLAFEYNGVYWHSELYKDKNYHYNKTKKCLDIGVRLIHIWEDDWLNKNEIVISRILNLLGKSKRIWARNCEIRCVSNSDSREFLNNNHLQGYVPCKISLGLYHKSELVSIMSFGNLRRSLGSTKKEGHYELLRFCNSNGFSVVGGASRLFKYFLKTIDVVDVISYADISWSTGNLYKKLGFKMDSITRPNYYYVINGIRKNRYTYRKDRLVSMGYDPNKSENDIMSELGYYKIYDGGNLKYRYAN